MGATIFCGWGVLDYFQVRGYSIIDGEGLRRRGGGTSYSYLLFCFFGRGAGVGCSSFKL